MGKGARRMLVLLRKLLEVVGSCRKLLLEVRGAAALAEKAKENHDDKNGYENLRAGAREMMAESARERGWGGEVGDQTQSLICGSSLRLRSARWLKKGKGRGWLESIAADAGEGGGGGGGGVEWR